EQRENTMPASRSTARPHWFFVLAVVLVVLGRAAAPHGQAARSRRPDLQGTWLNNTATPLERPKQFGSRAYFTPDEAREFERHYLVDTLAHPVDRYKAFEHEAAAGDIDTYEPGHVLPNLRNSLIIDPADG